MKRALITGGARRIGAELVRTAAKLGFEVWVHCRNSHAEAEQLIASLPDSAVHRITVCDFSDENAVRGWLETLPEFELLVNNASCYRLTKPGMAETPETRQTYWQVNFHVPLELTQKVRSGLVVNLLDADVLTPDGGIRAMEELPQGVDSYLETRKALAYKTLELAQKLAPQVRINGIAPGAVLPPKDCIGPGMQKILSRIPLARPVQPGEIAQALTLFESSPSLTGVILPVDGGMHLIRN